MSFQIVWLRRHEAGCQYSKVQNKRIATYKRRGDFQITKNWKSYHTVQKLAVKSENRAKNRVQKVQNLGPQKAKFR